MPKAKLKKLPRIDHIGFTSVRQLFRSPRRWFKGSYYSADGTQCCLLGAIDHCYLNGDQQRNAENKLKQSITKFQQKQGKTHINTNIADFNDASRRKFADIRWVIEDAKI